MPAATARGTACRSARMHKEDLSRLGCVWTALVLLASLALSLVALYYARSTV